MSMKVLLTLILIALVVIIVLLWSNRTGTRAAGPRDSPPRTPVDPFADPNATAGDPRTIKVGDMLEYLGCRYFVRGSLRMAEDGYRWSEHLLEEDAQGVRRWISVEEDPDLEVVLWAEHENAVLLPGEKTLVVDGIEYRKDEHGNAAYRGEGSTGLGDQGTVEYVDYEGVGPSGRGRYLSFERYGSGRWETGLGERIPTGSLTVYPGS
jgi:Domain of unknown function (DUF4178)